MPIKSKDSYMSVSDQTFNQLMLKIRQKMRKLHYFRHYKLCGSIGFLCINWLIHTYNLMDTLRETIVVVGNKVDVFEARLFISYDYRFISICYSCPL